MELGNETMEWNRGNIALVQYGKEFSRCTRNAALPARPHPSTDGFNLDGLRNSLASGGSFLEANRPKAV